MKPERGKRKYIRRSILVTCAMLALSISIGVGMMGFATYYNGMMNEYRLLMENTMKMVLRVIDGDDMATCMETGQPSENMAAAQDIMDGVKESFPFDIIQYLYIVRPLNTNEEDNMEYVMMGHDAEEQETAVLGDSLGAPTGTDYSAEMAEAFLNQFNTAHNEMEYFTNNYMDPDSHEMQYVYTGYIPIQNGKGEPVATLAMDLSMGLVYSTIRTYIVIVLITSVVLTILFMVILSIFMDRRIIKPISSMEQSAQKFVRDSRNVTDPSLLNFEKIELKNNDEIMALADALDCMSEDLKNYMVNLLQESEDKQRMESQLHVAKQIQADLMPMTFFPDRKDFELYASVVPANEIGGDLYDFFLIDDDHLGMVIADVAGEGIPEAMFMVVTKTLLKNQAIMGGKPSDIFYRINNQLCENNTSEMFVTAWMGILEISTGKVIAANAGHEYPIVRNPGESFELFRKKHCFVLGGFENTEYQDYEFKLEPGGCLFVYTDGIALAQNEEDELFGTERMLEVLNRTPDAAPEELFHNLIKGIDGFVGKAPQFDDITMLFLKLGKSEE